MRNSQPQIVTRLHFSSLILHWPLRSCKIKDMLAYQTEWWCKCYILFLRNGPTQIRRCRNNVVNWKSCSARVVVGVRVLSLFSHLGDGRAGESADYKMAATLSGRVLQDISYQFGPGFHLSLPPESLTHSRMSRPHSSGHWFFPTSLAR